jgi:predicted RND superfamily exporter protein
MLTSLTTFAGLTPIMLEGSTQAQFVKPMAISLAFGVLFASLITLFLVPSVYLVLEDVRRLLPKSRQLDDGDDEAALPGRSLATIDLTKRARRAG